MPLFSAKQVQLSLVVCLACAPVLGAQAVEFQDGRVLEVEGIREEGGMLTLLMPGGASIAVPAWRITGWQELAAARRTPPPTAPGDLGHAWRQAAGGFAALIERAATAHRVDPVLLTAVARTESSLDPLAVSPKGASGLMQLMPATAERFGVRDVFDVTQNVDGGARYLRWLLERFEGDTELALAGYNAGERAVERYSGVPPYPETEAYVRKVLREADRLAGEGSVRRAVAPLAAPPRTAVLTD
jgi:soluble lytic murein transglycosylase-like protein